jgi:hypothetical protein
MTDRVRDHLRLVASSSGRVRRHRERIQAGKVVLSIEVDAAQIARLLFYTHDLEDPWCEDRFALAAAVELHLQRLIARMGEPE